MAMNAGIDDITDPARWDKLIEDMPGFVASSGVEEEGRVEEEGSSSGPGSGPGPGAVGDEGDKHDTNHAGEIVANGMASYAEMHSAYDLAAVVTRLNRSQFGKGKRMKHLAKEDRRIARAAEREDNLGAMDSIMKGFVLGDYQEYEVCLKKKISRNFMSLARLYNVRASLVGITKSQNVVLLERTAETRLPSGNDEAERLRFFAREHQAVERYKAGENGRPAHGRNPLWVPPENLQYLGVPHQGVPYYAGAPPPAPPPKPPRAPPQTVFVSSEVMQFDGDKVDVSDAKSKREVDSQETVVGGVEGRMEGEAEGRMEGGVDGRMEGGQAGLGLGRASGSAPGSKLSACSLEFKPRSQMTKEELTKLRKKLAKDQRRAESSMEERIEGIGSFERHTRGIGSKLLGKMGYTKGEGLGKRRDGTALALEVKPRERARGGLGAPAHVDHV